MKPKKTPNGGAGADEDSPHLEKNLVPVAGGSTDLGFGFGFFAGLARVQRGIDPFIWNIDSSGLVTFKYSSAEGLNVPYQDFYARLSIPRLFGVPLRLEIRPSYTWETVDYFGLGNASSVEGADTSSPYFNYTRGHPQLDVDVRTKIVDHFIARVGFRYVFNKLSVGEHSKLADDQRMGTDDVKRLIGPTRSHSVALFKYGLQVDTRDSETSSHRGTFDTVDLKLSPGGTKEFPYRYGEATLNLRGFLPLKGDRIVLATRLVGDWMFGNVPFYELSRFDDTYAIGGTLGVRGVPAQRYYGKIKVLGNVEVRFEVTTFKAFGKDLILGLVPFFDAGRLWTETAGHPDLDGHGLGLKYGYGGGLRVQSGSSFVIRADVAGSPDATPVSGYFAAGQVF